MLDREPFLLAIFAAPDDDLPRLQFADWLDDHGFARWAELIRVQCELAHTPGDERLTGREDELLRASPQPLWGFRRGFQVQVIDAIQTTADALADPDGFRRHACEHAPHWYGATRLAVAAGLIATPGPLDTIFASPVTRHLTALDLSGREEQLAPTPDAAELGLIDFVHKPAITTRMVEHLCGLREARRLVSLDLRRNDLDNDALRALARSTNLIRLRQLFLTDEGSPRYKGKVWSQVLERFGPEVVQ